MGGEAAAQADPQGCPVTRPGLSRLPLVAGPPDGRADQQRGQDAGATRVEGYPASLPKKGGELPAAFAWTGLPSVFEACGFTRLADAPAKRPIYVKSLARARVARS